MIPLDHPIDSLTIEDGKLFELRGAAKGNGYMDRPPIEVVEKAGYTEKDGDLNTYSLKLNTHTCPVWRKIFKSYVQSPVVRFEGDIMRFDCEPTSLASDYTHVKKGIQATNEEYGRARAELFPFVEEVDKKRVVLANREKERADQIRKVYDDLQL
jgi:hypothetical protein